MDPELSWLGVVQTTLYASNGSPAAAAGQADAPDIAARTSASQDARMNGRAIARQAIALDEALVSVCVMIVETTPRSMRIKTQLLIQCKIAQGLFPQSLGLAQTFEKDRFVSVRRFVQLQKLRLAALLRALDVPDLARQRVPELVVV